MVVTMSTPISATYLPCLALLLLSLAGPAAAQNIYKCTHGGQVEYTDKPCAGRSGELVHKADDSEIIDRYLRLGQNDAAKNYADARQLQALYQQRLEAYVQAANEQARRQVDEAAAARQREQQAQQQALADDEANRVRLTAENEALRQQNAQYQDELTQPAGIYASPYWGAPPPRWPRRDDQHDRDDDHGDHGPIGPRSPAFHPCETLAGGRLRC